jgi:molybdopterin biosynthesis enzyme
VLSFAPRISHRLLDALVRLDDPTVPIAETYRRVAAEAVRSGLPRPSYQRIRVLVHESRRLRRRRGPTTAAVLLDVALRVRAPDAVLDHLSGVGVPELRGR